jgi:DNA replication protein DnaC
MLGNTRSSWGNTFPRLGDAAMVDRLGHHAEVIVLKGDSYRLKGKGKEVLGSESTR